jgi:hypothetical protein
MFKTFIYIKKTMPRGFNSSYYHYKITDKDTGNVKYYRTCEDIRIELGICRTSVYHRIAGNHKALLYSNLLIERDYVPVGDIQQA